MKIVIREAETEDYNSLIELFDEIDAIHRDHHPRIFQKPNGPVREINYYIGLISDESTAVFVAELEGNIVGFVHAIVRDAADIPILVPRRFAIIDGIVVRSKYKKRGIGRMLMKGIEEWIKEKGASSIELNVYEFNEEAITFYESLGYKTFSRKLSKDLS
jgi:ribosomal protein S18 acetylase RimI-like enzyme